MRITENRMTELAAERTANARERVARSGESVVTGLRVVRPSDDPAGWASAERARLRRASSEARGGGIAASTELLAQTDGALATLGEVAARTRELAIQAANSTVNGEARRGIALEVRALASAALAAANSTGSDGQHLFAGSRGDVAPFDAAGNYFGDFLDPAIESSPGAFQTVGINGSVLTPPFGINLLAELETLAVALETDDTVAIQASVGSFEVGVEQIARARSNAGALSASLRLADEARADFELGLAEHVARGVEADSIAAASDLAGASQALEVSQAVTQMVIDLTRAI